MARGKSEITPSHITGMVAVAISVYFLVTQREDLSIVAASIYFTLACTTDTLKAKIPNLLNVCLLIAGIAINTVTLGTQGFLLSVSGLGLGIGLLLLPYLMGGMGAGDVKALGALGALVGPYDLLYVFVYMGFFGGGLALLHYLHKVDIRKTISEVWLSVGTFTLTQKAQYIAPIIPDSSKEALRFPYSAAIAFGYYSFVHWGGIL